MENAILQTMFKMSPYINFNDKEGKGKQTKERENKIKLKRLKGKPNL